MPVYLLPCLLIVIVCLSCTAYVSVALMYRLTRGALAQIERTRADLMRLTETMVAQLRQYQADQTSLSTELLVHKTLLETGNEMIAGQMLHHGNAHDSRNQPPGWAPPKVKVDEDGDPMGPHDSPTILYSDGEDEPPLPGEED